MIKNHFEFIFHLRKDRIIKLIIVHYVHVHQNINQNVIQIVDKMVMK